MMGTINLTALREQIIEQHRNPPTKGVVAELEKQYAEALADFTMIFFTEMVMGVEQQRTVGMAQRTPADLTRFLAGAVSAIVINMAAGSTKPDGVLSPEQVDQVAFGATRFIDTFERLMHGVIANDSRMTRATITAKLDP